MLRDLQELRRRENLDLAPYAVHNTEPQVLRIHAESSHPFRTDFQRDRDRIFHSRAFRRLENKTQVFLSGSGDHLRNRLTHTIEVAGISRTFARALSLNEDLAEAIALAHDLGHTPFGHAGERALHQILADCGGFDHNLQSLRIVDTLEIKYPDYDGLNLTRALRHGLVKHRTAEFVLDGEPLKGGLSLEAQVADLADDLTYYGHDVDDGLDSGLITLAQLRDCAIWSMATEEAQKAGLQPGTDRFVSFAVRCLINRMVGDAIRYSAERIEQESFASVEEVTAFPIPLITFSPEYLLMTQELKRFLRDNLYYSGELKKLHDLSLMQMQVLFDRYCDDPGRMGSSARDRIGIDGLERAVGDYIAGMTDSFAVSEYLRLK